MTTKRKAKKRGAPRQRRIKESFESVRHMPEVNYKPPVSVVEHAPEPMVRAKKEESFWNWLLGR